MTTRLLQRVAIVTVTLVAMYAGAGFLLLPWLIERNGAAFLEGRLARSVTIGDARVNPFLLTLDLQDVRIAGERHEQAAAGTTVEPTDRAGSGAADPPILAFDSLHADLELRGLFSRTWTIAALTVDGLSAHIVLERDGTLNVVDLARRLTGEPTDQPDAAPPDVLLRQVEIRAASLQFTEMGSGMPASITIAPLNLSVTGLSTMTNARGTYSMTATLPDNGSVELRGEIALRPQISASGTLQLRKLQASALWPFLRDRLGIDELQATAGLTGRFTYDAADSLQLEALSLTVTGLRMARRDDDEPLLVLQRFEATGGRVDFARRTTRLERVAAASGAARAALDAKGDHNWAIVSDADAADAGPQDEGARRTEDGWTIRAESVHLDRVGLHFVDRSRAPALALDVEAITAAAQVAITTARPGQFRVSGMDVRIEDLVVRAADAAAPEVRVAFIGLEQGMIDMAARNFSAERVHISDGRAALVRDREGQVALFDLLGIAADEATQASQLAADPRAGVGPPWQYDISAVDVEAITLVVGDRTFDPAINYDLLVESIAVKSLSSDVDTDIEFNARIDVKQGGSALLNGTYTTGRGAVKSKFELDRLAVGQLRAVARRYTGLSIGAGLLSVEANLRYMPADQAFNLQAVDLSLDLTELAVSKPGDTQSMLALQRIEASGGAVDFNRRTVSLQKLVLENGQVRANVDREGHLDWKTAGPAPVSGSSTSAAPRSTRARAGGAPAASELGSSPWDLRVAALRLDAVAAHYVDHSRNPAIAVDIDRLDANLAIQMKYGGERIEFSAERLALQAQQILAGAPGPASPLIALKSASIADGRFDLAERRIGASQVLLQFDDMRVVRDADGRLTLIDFLLPEGAARESARVAGAGRPDWQYDLRALRVEPFGIHLSDQGFEPPLSFSGTLQLDATDIANDERLAFTTALALDSGGSLKIEGDAETDFSELHAAAAVNQLVLVPLQPLLARFAAVDLRSGRLSANARLRFGSGDPALLMVEGAVRITDMLLTEALSEDRLLSWQQLDADGVRFDRAAGSLSVSTVTVDKAGAKIVISEKRAVNLAQLIQRDTQTASPDTDGPPVPTTERADPPSTAFEFRIERVLLRDGEVDFADHSLVLPFSTTVTALNGTIAGISNDQQRRADVKANGLIPPYGSARVEGGIVPFAPATFTDLRVRFSNVQVPPLSPYTATFAGRTVESGRLWLDLSYRIKNGELLGSNDIRLSDFTLGKRVEAPGAADVPLDLAVALLTDSKGEINLSVPVRGDLESPSFSVAGAIRQALGNVVQRIVSAPFRALAALFGGSESAESLASIDFQAGSTDLRPEQREKLDRLVGALKERPQLNLVVSAPYDRQVDKRALQIEAATRELARALGQGSIALDDVGPIAFDDPKTRAALEGLLSKQAGPEAARLLDAEPGDGNGNSRQRYEALFERLAATYPVSPDRLRLLAAHRAQAIAEHLSTQGLHPQRVRTGSIAAVSESPDDAISARLAVDADRPAG